MQEISNSHKPAGFFSDLPTRTALAVLRAYKWAISPMLPPSCRYTPTCSEYAAEAIARYGVLRGSLLAAWRVLRCHPFVKGGFDPVPHNVHVAAALQGRSKRFC